VTTSKKIRESKEQLVNLKKLSNVEEQNKMLGELIDRKVSDPVLIKPHFEMNFNEDHFYSRQSNMETRENEDPEIGQLIPDK